MYQVTFYDRTTGAIDKVIPAEAFDDGVAAVAKAFADRPETLSTCIIDASWDPGAKLGALSISDADGALLALVADADFAPTSDNASVVEAVNALTIGRTDLVQALFKPEGLAAFAAEEAAVLPKPTSFGAPAWR